MKTLNQNFGWLVIVLTAFLMLGAGGCANQSPTQTALDAHTSYNVVMSGLTQARHAGLINDATKAQIEKVRAPAYDLIGVLDDAALHDDPAKSKSAYQQFLAILPTLQRYLLQYQKPPPAPLK